MAEYSEGNFKEMIVLRKTRLVETNIFNKNGYRVAFSKKTATFMMEKLCDEECSKNCIRKTTSGNIKINRLERTEFT